MVGEAFVANERAALEQIGANAPGAAEGRNPEYLHQLRVGVRRLRSALRAFRQLLRRRRTTEIDRRLRRLLRALGAARDWDVCCVSLPGGELLRRAQRERAKAQRIARAVVTSARFRDALGLARDWAHGAPWRSGADPAEPIRGFARRALRRLFGSLREDAEGIDWRATARRHKVRIKVKRLRYGCEFLASAFPHRSARAFLESLRTLQDILGEMNDIEVQRGLLRKLVPGGSPLKLVESEWAVREKLEPRERALIAALGPAWTAFESRAPFWERAAAARV